MHPYVYSITIYNSQLFGVGKELDMTEQLSLSLPNTLSEKPQNGNTTIIMINKINKNKNTEW